MKTLPDDYTVRMIDMPISVGGWISECPDGHIDVYINARLSRDGQRRAAEHEFDHWRNDDFRNGLDIREIEGRETRKLPPIFKARDLLPKAPPPQPKPEPQPRPAPKKRPKPLTAHQKQVLLQCLAEMDDIFLPPVVDY